MCLLRKDGINVGLKEKTNGENQCLRLEQIRMLYSPLLCV